MDSFSKIIGNKALLRFIEEKGLVNPTPVQKKIIPRFAEWSSVKILAPTGTGKTLSYALPLVEFLKVEEEKGFKGKRGTPRAVVLAPTRELANQIFKVFKEIAHHAKIRIRLLVSQEGEKRNFANEEIDILVCAPGKLASAIKKNEINGKEVRFLVMDEADQLLDMGFSKDIEGIYDFLDKELVKVSLFSATDPVNLDEFLRTAFSKRKFESVVLDGVHLLQKHVETFNIHLGEKEKDEMCEEFLKRMTGQKGIIFVNKKERAEPFFKKLIEKYPKKKFFILHGGMEIRERQKSYDLFKSSGEILISTDITARGIDIVDLTWVLNYDLPFEAVYYIHRAGRAGRAKNEGQVFNFVTPHDHFIIQRINESIRNQTALKLKTISTKSIRPVTPKPEQKEFVRKSKQLKRTPRYSKKRRKA